MSESEQTRREFCTQACRLLSVAAVGGSLATALESCGGGGGLTSPDGRGGGTNGGSASSLPTISGSLSGGTVSVSLDSSSPLAAVGSAALVQTSGGLFLVAHVAQDTFTAVTAMCTHEACTITGFSGQSFVCPCHGSRFSTSGQVQSGPAVRSLRSYGTRVANDVLTFSV